VDAFRDDDVELFARAVRDLPARTGFPVAFGGPGSADGAIHITTIAGGATGSLEGLVVAPDRGLGGRALTERRPRLTMDYRTAKGITHDYDRAVLGEGISTLFAVPVFTDGTARGVIYCGSRAETPAGDRVTAQALSLADEIAAELRVRDEVRRRLALMPAKDGALPSAAREELRESYAELRSIAAAVKEAEVRERLERLERRLATLSRTDAVPTEDVRLSPREIDVLACAALGATNAGIAAALDLKELTVKSYLASAMAKLDASTRHAAVVKARRAGILP
jgi:LuxR family transcriptional regulator, regulator of acetate metabolism